MDSSDDIIEDLAKRQADDIGGLANSASGAANGMVGSLAKRQLGGVTASVLSNPGTAASHLGKLVTGKHYRDDEMHDDNYEEMSGPEEVAKEVAEREKTAEEATKTFPSPSNKGPAKGPLGKRQVPPIAGTDLPMVVKAVVANPSMMVAPLTKCVSTPGVDLEAVLPN
ncbi:hypothetical protein BGW36DRAFT_432143 [Talaromyces proteolyticus]|uniref:Uncharacterized protein n=1 Tax=Talaromyces proteolyticus TaxID=1131652 RepID=A0AAD4PU03_9EURO|nr:uncharacterized protein BGW36DRAFT_432143 [Talaromyces proteolyticus]KAH8691595.1 hypothetical protein BGW36DRAFT_432143 [Talaromyces proteolyticus]